MWDGLKKSSLQQTHWLLAFVEAASKASSSIPVLLAMGKAGEDPHLVSQTCVHGFGLALVKCATNEDVQLGAFLVMINLQYSAWR